MESLRKNMELLRLERSRKRGRERWHRPLRHFLIQLLSHFQCIFDKYISFFSEDIVYEFISVTETIKKVFGGDNGKFEFGIKKSVLEKE